MKRRLCALFLVLALLSLCFPAALAAEAKAFPRTRSYEPGMFPDVAEDSWYEANVRTAYELGLMQGNADGTFNPEGNLRVIEAIVTFCRLRSIYLEDGADFTAEEGEKWYQPYLDYVNATQIMYFGPQSGVPSEWPEEMCLCFVYESEDELLEDICRIDYAMILSLSLPPEALPECNTVVYGAIPDVLLDRTGAEAVYWLYRSGILTGNNSKGVFAPDSLIQRCQAAAIISRLADPALRVHITLDQVDFNPVPLEEMTHYTSLRKSMNDEQYREAYDYAVELVTPLAKLSLENQLYYITVALRNITDSEIVYSMSAPHYNDPYGFFIDHAASCAGCTRATGLCLDILGIPYEHVNDGAYTHQWCRVPVGDGYWIADAYGLYVGPEFEPYQHPNSWLLGLD